ncbi:MAG: helix-turn-helix domain-containing protein [Chloroflexia bacterium]|nr:helix-turn-helix domain-containing protein [Chloroflexia bacterium]
MADGRPRPMGTIVHLTPRDGRPRGRIIRLDTGPSGVPPEPLGPPGREDARPRRPASRAPGLQALLPVATPPRQPTTQLTLPGTAPHEDGMRPRDGWNRRGHDLTGPPVSVDEAALMATVGRQILDHRKRLGLSQYTLAAAIHCDRSAVCRWESGNRMPSLTHLVGLCQVLGCSPATLLGMEPGEPDQG